MAERFGAGRGRRPDCDGMHQSDQSCSASRTRQDRFDVVVAELLDAGGLGEKIIPFLRHAKSRQQ